MKHALAATTFLALLAVALPAADPAARGLTHGPMIGNVTSQSIRVWARVRHPEGFRVLYAENSELRTPMASAPVRTQPEHDFAGWSELRGLKADTKYYYAIEVGGRIADTRSAGRLNSFRTLPDAAAMRHPTHNPDGRFNFSFEVGSCNLQSKRLAQLGKTIDATYGTMLRQIKDRVSFHILNGDWIYEDAAVPPWGFGRGREVTAAQWQADEGLASRPPVVDLAQGVTGLWQNYKTYLERGAQMAAFHREVPLFVMFDDHEIYNDIVGTGQVGLRLDSSRPELRRSPFDAPGHNQPTDFRPLQRTPEAEVERAVFRDPALRAWQDFLGWANPDAGLAQPLHFGRGRLETRGDILTDAQADFSRLDLAKSATLHVHWGQANSGVYEIVRIVDRHRVQIRPAATTAEDARYSVGANHHTRFRVGNCEFFLVDTRGHRSVHNKRNPHDSTVSMLGPRQLAWLIDGVSRSDATFIFIVSSVSFVVPHELETQQAQDSKDESWTAFVHERDRLFKVFARLDKPVFLLTGDIHNSFAIRVAPKVWEFMAGPHQSNNHMTSEMANVPLSGPYLSRGWPVTVKWGTGFLPDAGRQQQPTYCVVQVNNVFNSPDPEGKPRWIAHPDPQVVFHFYDGATGEPRYSQAVSAHSP